MVLREWFRFSAMNNCANALESKSEANSKTKKTQKMLDGSEKSMMPILLASQNSIIKYDKTVLARQEFSAGTGIADVVMFSIDDKALSKRLKKKQAALTDYRLLSTYLAITRKPSISKDELVSSLSFSKKSVYEEIIPTLVDAGLIEEIDSKLLCLVDEIKSPVMKCVAIEAKVKDWKGGIKQASRYKEFADETYLAIYKKFSRVPLENIELFKMLDIGLLIVEDGHVELAYQPRNSHVKALNRLLASERLISTLDDFNKPFMSREPFSTNSL